MKVKDINSQSHYSRLDELQERVCRCRETLFSLLDEWHSLKTEVEPRLIFHYDSLFGELEIELQDKTRNFHEIDRRVELLSLRLRRGEKLTRQTLKFVNTVVSSEINKKYNSPPHSLPINDCPVNIKYEIPRLYRDLVKHLHPDVNDETKRNKKLWNNVQFVYKKQDYERLRLYHHLICYAGADHLIMQEDALKTEIRQLEFNILSERKKINRLKMQEPFVFENALSDAVWVSSRQKMLINRIENIKYKIHHKKRMFNYITAGIKSSSPQFQISDA